MQTTATLSDRDGVCATFEEWRARLELLQSQARQRQQNTRPSIQAAFGRLLGMLREAEFDLRALFATESESRTLRERLDARWPVMADTLHGVRRELGYE